MRISNCRLGILPLQNTPRPYLIGSLDGKRDELAAKGVSLDFFYIADFQAIPSGVLRQTQAG
jgi:hypothetical protein